MKIRIAAALPLVLAGALALAGCTSSAPSEHSGHGAPDAAASDTPAGANAADVMFAQMMIPHHEQAIEMSDMLLEKEGVDPRVVDLAERIKAAQAPEIEQLEGWLEEWGADPAPESAGHGGHGDGMMTEEDMAALEAASGAEASRLFLEQMIVHHEGAVEMAETQISDGENADAVALAEDIVAAQTDEIAEMKELLSAL